MNILVARLKTTAAQLQLSTSAPQRPSRRKNDAM
jgi:hypothetical protein